MDKCFDRWDGWIRFLGIIDFIGIRLHPVVCKGHFHFYVVVTLSAVLPVLSYEPRWIGVVTGLSSMIPPGTGGPRRDWDVRFLLSGKDDYLSKISLLPIENHVQLPWY